MPQAPGGVAGGQQWDLAPSPLPPPPAPLPLGAAGLVPRPGGLLPHPARALPDRTPEPGAPPSDDEDEVNGSVVLRSACIPPLLLTRPPHTQALPPALPARRPPRLLLQGDQGFTTKMLKLGLWVPDDDGSPSPAPMALRPLLTDTVSASPSAPRRNEAV